MKSSNGKQDTSLRLKKRIICGKEIIASNHLPMG